MKCPKRLQVSNYIQTPFGHRTSVTVRVAFRSGNFHVYSASITRSDPCRPLDIVLCRMLAENESHDGDTSPERDGKHPPMSASASQRKDLRCAAPRASNPFRRRHAKAAPAPSWIVQEAGVRDQLQVRAKGVPPSIAKRTGGVLQLDSFAPVHLPEYGLALGS